MAIFKETNKIPKKFKSAKECFYFRCYYTDLNGNRKRKQGPYRLRQKEAKEDEIEFLNSIKDMPTSSNMTIGELIDDYLRYQQDKVRITTYDRMKIDLRYLETIKKIKIEELTVKQFENWKQEINNKNFSTQYKNNIYKKLRAVLNYGERIYNLNINVLKKMAGFSNPNELKKEMLFYTKDEFDTFIKQETDLKWICFFSTLFYCGLRQGEALALNWHDIDFENNTIKINKSLANRLKGKNHLILPPKTKGSIRTIPMPINLSNNLKQRYNALKKYENFSNDWFVFGEIFPLPTSTIQARRDKLVELSGVKRIRIHDFRHSCASLLISKGANITLVARFLGHSDISTTLNTYSHFYKNDLTNLISHIDK